MGIRKTVNEILATTQSLINPPVYYKNDKRARNITGKNLPVGDALELLRFSIEQLSSASLQYVCILAGISCIDSPITPVLEYIASKGNDCNTCPGR